MPASVKAPIRMPTAAWSQWNRRPRPDRVLEALHAGRPWRGGEDRMTHELSSAKAQPPEVTPNLETAGDLMTTLVQLNMT